MRNLVVDNRRGQLQLFQFVLLFTTRGSAVFEQTDDTTEAEVNKTGEFPSGESLLLIKLRWDQMSHEKVEE